MKRLTLSAVLLLCILVASAQFSPGDKYLTGTVSFSTSKTEFGPGNEEKNLGISFSPSILKFKSDRKATGFRLLSNYSEHKEISSSNLNKTDQLTAGAGVFCQRIFPLGKGFYFFTEKGVTASILWSKNTQSAFANTSSKTTGFTGSVYITPGFGYKLTDRLLMNLNLNNLLSLNYTHQKNEATVSGSTTTTGKSSSLNLSSSLNNNVLSNVGITFGWKLK
jgi:hypothetical protein